MATAPADRREHERIAADLPAVCRAPASPSRARLIDVSRTGCRFRMVDGLAVPNGATVHLDFGPGRRVTGQVMWSGPRAAGMRFARPLASNVAVALGLETAPVVEIEPPAELPSKPRSPIAHWLRRLLGRAA